MADNRFDQGVNTPIIALVGFLSTALVFALVVFVEVLYYQAQSQQVVQKDLGERPVELTKLVEGQQAELAQYRWVDEKNKVVAIPITRAMELTLRDLKK
jgi:hypothetical protein